MEQQHFEEAEQILSWREMQPGVYIFVDKEMRRVNKWMKSITVVTLKQQVGGPSTKYYAPPSLHYGLESLQTRGLSGMKASLYLKAATSSLFSSTLQACKLHTAISLKKKKKLSFEKLNSVFYNG